MTRQHYTQNRADVEKYINDATLSDTFGKTNKPHTITGPPQPQQQQPQAQRQTQPRQEQQASTQPKTPTRVIPIPKNIVQGLTQKAASAPEVNQSDSNEPSKPARRRNRSRGRKRSGGAPQQPQNASNEPSKPMNQPAKEEVIRLVNICSRKL